MILIPRKHCCSRKCTEVLINTFFILLNLILCRESKDIQIKNGKLVYLHGWYNVYSFVSSKVVLSIIVDRRNDILYSSEEQRNEQIFSIAIVYSSISIQRPIICQEQSDMLRANERVRYNK